MGFSVSFWFRMLKRARSKFTTSSCSGVKLPLVFTDDGNTYSYRGFCVKLVGCNTNAIEVNVRATSRYHRVIWGNAMSPPMYKKWNHLAFSLGTDDILRFYVNGVKVAEAAVFF